MQCVLLAAGKGHRLKMDVSNKCLVQVNGLPLINYSLDLLTPRLFHEIIVVVGYHSENIKQYLGKAYQDIKLKYVNQNQQLGIAHAVKMAIPQIQDDFMMCLSDEIITAPRIAEMYNFFKATDSDCVCGVTHDEDEYIKKAYTLQMNTDGLVQRIVEKPVVLFNNWRGTGLCMMKASMLSVLDKLEMNPDRNEYEMGNWIQLAIDKGLSCRSYEVGDMDFNINEAKDIQRAEAYLQGKGN